MEKELQIKDFESVFTEEIGTFEGNVHLEVDPLVTPEQTPLRKVSLAVKDRRLEAELSRLEDLGILMKVSEPTDWVSSLVVLEKKDSQNL